MYRTAFLKRLYETPLQTLNMGTLRIQVFSLQGLEASCPHLCRSPPSCFEGHGLG